MAKITFIKKVHLGSGNYEYTYKCECDNATNEIKVTSGNDMQAEMLAELECEEMCNQTTSSPQEISDLRQLLQQSGTNHEVVFTVSVKEINKENYVIDLCTGDNVIVPKNTVKSFELVGLFHTDKAVSKIAQLSFNTENKEGLLIQQLAQIINKLTTDRGEVQTLNRTSNEGKGEQHLQIKIPCSGRACDPQHSYYTSKKQIIDYSLSKVEACSVSNVTKLGSYKLRVLHDSLGGVRCGTTYSGRAYFDIIIASK